MSYPAIPIAGKDRKFAFVKGAARKRPARIVTHPDSPNAKAFFIVKQMSYTHDKGSDAFCKAVQIIHTISELDTALSNAEKVAEQSGNSWIQEQFIDNRHDITNALGLALHSELSTIYEEEQV